MRPWPEEVLQAASWLLSSSPCPRGGHRPHTPVLLLGRGHPTVPPEEALTSETLPGSWDPEAKRAVPKGR